MAYIRLSRAFAFSFESQAGPVRWFFQLERRRSSLKWQHHRIQISVDIQRLDFGMNFFDIVNLPLLLLNDYGIMRALNNWSQMFYQGL